MKTIGVCISLTHSEMTREFMRGLYNEAVKEGYRLLCFNNILDKKFINDKGALEVYKLIPYEKLSAVVLMHGTINDNELFEHIKQEAAKAGVPVILAREYRDDVISVSGVYENAFRELIKHVVINHNAKDIFYISGRTDFDANPNSDSSIRYKILKETLAELNVPFDDSKVGCGDYWEHPTIQLIDNLLENREKLPDAIICGNDIMAMAATQRLSERGINVPEDIIVTGFDGLQCARFMNPQLTTCLDNMAEMGKLLLDVIKDEDNTDIRHLYYQYKFIPSRSCGCEDNGHDIGDESYKLFRAFRLNEADEDRTNRWHVRSLISNSLEMYKSNVGNFFNDNEVLLLREDDELVNDSGYENKINKDTKLYRITNKKADFEDPSRSNLNEIYDVILSDENNNGYYIISAIVNSRTVLGIYLEKIYNMFYDGAPYHRHVHAITKGLVSCISQVKNQSLERDIERNKFHDPCTGLDNLRGFERRFERFSADFVNHQKYLEYCVFSFINHDEILADFKNNKCEECVRFIADTLVSSHPSSTYVGRISEAAFVVMVDGIDNDKRQDIILESVGKFYTAIQNFNRSDPDGPQIEVSSGSIQLDPGWEGEAINFTKSAFTELYKNRSALNAGAKTEDLGLDLAEESEKLLLVNQILKNNMLTYFMQPIVDAHTGDIIAYEALMRTTGGINMSPLELLSIAKRHRLLPRVEHATVFGIFDMFAKRQEEFGDKLLFLNTIPGHFLAQEEVNEIADLYADLLNRCVVELTEDDSTSLEELQQIRSFGKRGKNMQIAIDDFGTGHSNIINLLQYNPQIIKLDRFLITDIHKDSNKQTFVENIISFAKDNGIKVLAEGVETVDELNMVIGLGVDLLQGYYLAKPSDKILQKLPENLVLDVVNANNNNRNVKWIV